MGNPFLPPSVSNPSSTNSATMSSSHSPQTDELKPQSNTVPHTKTPGTENNLETQEEIIEKDTILEEKQDEEEECGFCLFMKEGGCRDPFTEWEKCVEQGEKNKEDIVEKCFQVTSALQKCMEAHSEYYAPILQVEKDVEAKVIAEFEKNKESLSMDIESDKFEQKEGL